MQRCGYCGRENEDNARNCRECGTELADKTDLHPRANAATASSSRINLEDIEDAFAMHDGFSRPSWLAIFKALRRYHAPEERLAAWTDVVSQWASRWEAELGDNYWMTSSGSFFLVSELDGEAAERLLQKANWLAQKIKGVLGELAWEDRTHILIIHVADEILARRFDNAVCTPAEQTEIERTAMERCPPCILIGGQDEVLRTDDITSGLVWSCLSHLPLPRWLQGGFATQLWRDFDCSPREMFDADLIPAHRRFWNKTTIQSFWAGTCRTEYAEQSNLDRELSNILVHVLREKTQSLVDFLRCANYYDAGQSAAQVCLKTDLGELAGTFLGPGHWTPDPLAIDECWDRVREMNSDEE